jgi:hypothetical protein
MREGLTAAVLGSGDKNSLRKLSVQIRLLKIGS